MVFNSQVPCKSFARICKGNPLLRVCEKENGAMRNVIRKQSCIRGFSRLSSCRDKMHCQMYAFNTITSMYMP